MCFINRDIDNKPDTIMLDIMGHIKLTDFYHLLQMDTQL